MKRLKILLILLSTVTLLSSCFLFKPSHKVIEYDEEVKLHDGSMIWVHIKRHYRLVGEPFQKSGYLPSVVEISWDTGFEGVGRKSVFFDEVMAISKYGDAWYITGSIPNNSDDNLGKSLNCKNVGIAFGKYGCTVAVNTQGFFDYDISKDDEYFNGWNILYPIGIKDWGLVPKPLDGKRISWLDKLDLENQQQESSRRLGKHL